MHEFFDLYKKCYNHCCCCSCYYYYKKNIKYVLPTSRNREFCGESNIILKKITKSYFNVEYIKFFYLLQKAIKLNLYNKNKCIHNINILTDIFINLYDNSNIDCNEKVESKIYNLYNSIIINKIFTT